jgi:L,D-transpeptidase catalytic domain
LGRAGARAAHREEKGGGNGRPGGEAEMRYANRRRGPIIGVCVLTMAIVPAFHELDFGDGGSVELRVDLSERRLYVHEGGEVVETYGVAVGRASNPTPTGTYRTGRIVWNPGWVPPPREWARKLKPREPGDPRNPMQGVKIYFREPWYFIHGTNDPKSIGTAASRGCLRMRPSDARELARLIERSGGSVTLVIRP